MQLISKGMYAAVYSPREDLVIEPLDQALFGANFYYFRVGGVAVSDEVVPMTEPVTVPPGASIRVFTLERFVLSERVLGLIGPCSEFVLGGFSLAHSPTVDPGFAGALEVVIRNPSDAARAVYPGMKIGKAVFFDVSDSLLDLHRYIDHQKHEAGFRERRRIGDDLFKFWKEKIVDAEGPIQERIRL